MIIESKCDKCAGTEFDIKCTDPKPSTTYALASEYFKGFGVPQVNDLLLRYRHYRAKCKKCGAIYEYSTPYGGF